MAGRSWIHVTSPVAEISKAGSLSVAARALLQPDHTAAAFLGCLAEAELFDQALAFLAHALPRREVVWWACRGVRQLPPAESPPAVVAALRAAEQWVLDPSEENRRAALSAAEAEGFDSAAGLAAAAAGWSGGNLSPPGLPAVAPSPHLTPRAACGAIALAALALGPDDLPQAFRSLIETGARVAEGVDRWDVVRPSRSAP